MEVNQMLFQCGWLLDQLRMDSTLQELLRELFGGLGMNPVEPLEALLPLYKLLSRNLYNMGKAKEAVKVLERMGHLEELKLAEDHPDQLASQHELAIAYDANGQVKEAVQLLEHVVKVKNTTLAEDHPSRLASQHALGIAYQEYEKTQSTGRSTFCPCYAHSIKHFY
jgi:tetratricopeptide (TPR) repeat protein